MREDKYSNTENKKLPSEVCFSYDYCQILADMNSHLQPEYMKLFEKYPLADGLRDISICMSASPTDVEGLEKHIREGRLSWAGIGWLVFIIMFVNASIKKGMSAVEYADWLYEKCDAINGEVGYRAAWIEAYGEIGNSVTWPKGSTFTKKEALEYFRNWLRDGRSLTEHWQSVVSPEIMSYYTHALSRNSDLRKLPIYYSEGTLYSIHEAFRNGFPLVVYEGQCSTMNAIQTGIAFVRGGAKMYDALWGADFSPWTGGPQGETANIDFTGRWNEGMTPEYLFRAWMAAYMSGCNTLLHEVSYCFFYSEPVENCRIPSDYGHKAMQFYGLTKGILADRGKPLVPFAIMLEEEHGYRGDLIREYTPDGERTYRVDDEDPDKRLNIWNNRVHTATRGDWQIHRLISHIWPTAKNQWGEICTGWPGQKVADTDKDLLTEMRLDRKDPKEFDRFLADSRYADCFDIINEIVPEDVLNKYYKSVVLAGEIKTDNGLWDMLISYMEKGGTVVAVLENLDENALKYFDIHTTQIQTEVLIENMNFDGMYINVKEAVVLNIIEKPSFIFKVLAYDMDTGHPLILQADIAERGRFYLCLAANGLDAKGSGISVLFSTLIKNLYESYTGVRYVGEPVQMIVNERDTDILVSLFNHTGKVWSGDLEFDKSKFGRFELKEVRDVFSDMVYSDPVNSNGSRLSIKIHVPAFEVKVISAGLKKQNKNNDRISYNTPLSEDDQHSLSEIIKKGPKELIGLAER